MKTLVIVDFQKDFANPSGSLYVNGAEKAEEAIVNYIMKNVEDLSDVIFTVDWHNPEHCSFKKNGGIWPVHCVQFSEGAGISDKIMKACIDNNIQFQVFKKGTEEETEEYGAFSYIELMYGPETEITFLNQAHDDFVYVNTNEFVVCGIAGDYCVSETIKNLIKHQDVTPLSIEVFKNGIASIDDGTKLDNFIKNNNIKTVE